MNMLLFQKEEVEKNGARHRDKDGRMTLLQYVVRNRNRNRT